MNKSDIKLLFVYNTNTGIFNSVVDVAHKIFSPQTYPCQLCRITHNNFKIKTLWKDFIDSNTFETIYIHKDEAPFLNLLHIKFPIIMYQERNSRLKTLIDSQSINQINSVSELITLITKELKMINLV